MIPHFKGSIQAQHHSLARISQFSTFFASLPSFKAVNASSAAMMPLFIAVCVPLIFGTFRKPAEQPMRAPPGNASWGML